MSFTPCPGSQTVKQPCPETIKCPYCSYELEIWSDEVQVKCKNCKADISRPYSPSCLDWCKYAKNCVGGDIYQNYMKNKAVTIKEKLLKELDAYFGDDSKRINHARKVMDYSEELLKEVGGDWYIVVPAAILHDVGLKKGVEDGAVAAWGILLKSGFIKKDIEEIAEIVKYHHHPEQVDTQNFKIIYDADGLVNFKEEIEGIGKQEIKGLIEKRFLTESGKKKAISIYLST